MITATIALLAMVATPAPSDHADHPGGDEKREFQWLAENLDNAIKTCSELAIRGARGGTEAGKREKLAVESGILRFLPTIPDSFRAFTERHGAARVGSWIDPHTQILLVAWDKAPTCRILVSPSAYVGGARPELIRLVQSDNFWKQQGADQTVEGDFIRTVLIPDDNPQAQVRPVLSITYNSSASEGQVMLNIGVSLMQKDSK